MRGRCVRLWHAEALGVVVRQPELGIRMALLGSLAKQASRSLVILRDALPTIIQHAKFKLRRSKALRRCRLVVPRRFNQIARHAAAFCQQPG